MTRKDYELISDAVIHAKWDPCVPTQEQTARNIASSIAISLSKQNPLFDEYKFMKACGFA